MFKLAFYLYAAGSIAAIDFYGVGDLDRAKLQAALPFKAGGSVPSEARKDQIIEAFKKAAGVSEASIDFVCCTPDGRYNAFVGLPEPNAPAIHYNPRPTGAARMPVEIDQLFQRLEADVYDAVRKNQGGEDDSQGFALGKYPPLHADQMRLREWARAHTFQIVEVLETARDDNQRAEAAGALGYAERGPRQIEALVRAAFDPSENVRNNAVRALLVLCHAGPDVARQVPAERFFPLLHSIVWTDRNKSMGLLQAITESRDPELLRKLRADALPGLVEMARWKDENHAFAAALLVGRIAGIEEQTLLQLLIAGKVEEIVSALK
jgi:hypothetical protein